MKTQKPKIRMIIFQDIDGFSAFSTIDDPFIAAMGSTFDEFLDNLMEAINLSFEDENFQYSLNEISLVSSNESNELTLRNSTTAPIKQIKD